MIERVRELEAFERELIAGERVYVERNFRLVEAMYEDAVALGAFPPKDPLEGIEVGIGVAGVVSAVSDAA